MNSSAHFNTLLRRYMKTRKSFTLEQIRVDRLIRRARKENREPSEQLNHELKLVEGWASKKVQRITLSNSFGEIDIEKFEKLKDEPAKSS